MTSQTDRVAVLVPVKAFDRAKVRLAPALEPRERAHLARVMAEHVLAAAAPLPVAVVCDDDDVADWARARGARVVLAPGAGLNGAVETGVAVLGELGHERVIVAHGDLPLAGPLAWLSRSVGVTLVPDHRDDGTNVACIPTHADFRFSYGPGSLARHEAEGRRLGLPVRIVRDPLLARDVDEPADLFGLEIA